jgi:hypothetical protein
MSKPEIPSKKLTYEVAPLQLYPRQQKGKKQAVCQRHALRRGESFIHLLPLLTREPRIRL